MTENVSSENNTFGVALEAAKDGKTITREGWYSFDVKVRAQFPDEHSKMTKPYLYMIKREERFPLDLSCESIFAEDWIILD